MNDHTARRRSGKQRSPGCPGGTSFLAIVAVLAVAVAGCRGAVGAQLGRPGRCEQRARPSRRGEGLPGGHGTGFSRNLHRADQTSLIPAHPIASPHWRRSRLRALAGRRGPRDHVLLGQHCRQSRHPPVPLIALAGSAGKAAASARGRRSTAAPTRARPGPAPGRPHPAERDAGCHRAAR